MHARIALAAALIGTAVPATHAADAARLAAGCAPCHGTNGQAIAGQAPLAGMRSAALAQALRAFQSGTRAGTVMPQLAKGYTGEEIDALAAWFAAQAPAR